MKKRKKNKLKIDLIKVRNVEYKVKSFKIEFGFPGLDDLETKDPTRLLSEPLFELKRFAIDIEIKKAK